jgi:putative membrane protein
MPWIKEIIIGMIIGGGMILPGVSGGILAVSFGVYEKLIDAVVNFFNDWKKNITFLFFIIIGIIIGAIAFGNLLKIVFDKYPMPAGFTFIGLILGGMPILFNKIEKNDTKKLHTTAFMTSCLISLLIFVVGKGFLSIDFSEHLNDGFMSQILLFITGIIYISGKVIPGISGSFLLMLIGMYWYMLDILVNPLALNKIQQLQLIPIIIGAITGFILLLRLINYLIKHYHNIFYSVIIGFVIGSISAIYPGFSFNYIGAVSIILFITAFVTSYYFSLESK